MIYTWKLNYIDRPKGIVVIRPKEGGKGKGKRVGIINKSNFEVGPAPDDAPTAEELEEMQIVADSYKSAEASRRQWAAFKFPEITAEVIGYCNGLASDLEKHLVSGTIQRAARSIRGWSSRSSSSGPEESVDHSQKQVTGLFRPTPEAIAGALYDIFSSSAQSKAKAKAKGDPRKGENTQLAGQWDLLEVARILLSQIPK